MSAHAANTTGLRRRVRRFLWILAAVAAGLFIAWELVEYFLDVDRYRPLIVEAVQETLGLPAAVENLDLELFPVPCVAAENVRIGEGDFQARASAVRLRFNVRKLVRGTIDIDEVKISGLEAVVPPDFEQLRQRVEQIPEPKLRASSGGRFQVSLNHVFAHEAMLLPSGSAEPWAVCDIDVYGVSSETASVLLKAELPVWGESAGLDTQLTVRKIPAGPEFSGRVSLRKLETARLAANEYLPPLICNMEADIAPSSLSRVTAVLTGNTAPAQTDSSTAAALTGSVSAKAWWLDGALALNDIRWAAQGITVEADATRYPDGVLASEVRNATITNTGWAAILDRVPSGAFRLAATERSEGTVRDVLISYQRGWRVPRMVRGSAEVRGLDLLRADGVPVFPNIEGDVSVTEGVLTVERLASQGAVFSGTIKPELDNRSAVLHLTGEIDLTRERLMLFTDAGFISDLRGRLQLDRITAVLALGRPMMPTLQMAGTLSDGRVTVTTDQFTDTFYPVSVRFAGGAETVELDGSAQAPKLGELSFEGRGTFETPECRGVVRVDLSAVELPLDPSGASTHVAAAVLTEYGPSEFEVALQLPSPERRRVSITFRRRGEPELEGSLVFVETGQTWQPDEMRLAGTAAGRAFAPILPADAALSGPVPIWFVKKRGEDRFEARGDLTDCDFSVGRYIRKKPGLDLVIEITGDAPPAGWAARRVDIECMGERLTGEIADNAVVFDPVSINLAPLAPLLPDGARLAGTTRGRFRTNPTEVVLDAHEVSIAVGKTAQLDWVSGTFQYGASGTIRCRDMVLRGANSDSLFDLDWTPRAWQGRLRGAQLDADAILALWGEADKFLGDAAKNGETTSDQSSAQGQLTVDMDRLLYGRGRFEAVHADIAVEPDIIRIANISARPYTGSVVGTADITRPAPGVGRKAKIDLKFAGVDARIVDEIAFVEPRHFTGAIDGEMVLTFPVGDGVNAIHGATGMVEFQGVRGSFGKLGITTRLLSVLRTTEVVRLRMPTFRDEGLAYDTSRGAATFKNGIMTLHSFESRNPTFEITASGAIDFPQEQTNIVIDVSLLGGVTGAMEAVGLRGAARTVRDYGSLRFAATGPPDSPTIRIIQGAAIDKVMDTVKTGPDAVRNILREGAGETIRSIFSR